jgi:hypothetical protein
VTQNGDIGIPPRLFFGEDPAHQRPDTEDTWKVPGSARALQPLGRAVAGEIEIGDIPDESNVFKGLRLGTPILPVRAVHIEARLPTSHVRECGGGP